MKSIAAVLTHFKEKVTYWISFKEMSALSYLPFLELGYTLTALENQEQQIWRLAAHHQLIASTKNVVKLGQTINQPSVAVPSIVTPTKKITQLLMPWAARLNNVKTTFYRCADKDTINPSFATLSEISWIWALQRMSSP